jgi:hypothetical protein
MSLKKKRNSFLTNCKKLENKSLFNPKIRLNATINEEMIAFFPIKKFLY